MYCYRPKLFKKNCLKSPNDIISCFVEFASARTTYFLKFVWSAELDWREDLLIGIVLVRCGQNMELLWVLGRRLDWLHYWRAALLNYVEFCRVEDRADCIAIIYLYIIRLGKQEELRWYLWAGGQEELNGFVVDLYIGRIGVLLIYIVVSVGGRLVVGCKYCFT